MGLLGLPVPGPGDVVRASAGALTALDQAIALVPRIVALVGTLEQLAGRAAQVIDEVDTVVATAAVTVGRVDAVIDAAEAVVERTNGVVDDASTIVGRTGGVVDGAEVVVGRTSGVVDDASAIVRRTSEVVEGADGVLGRSSRLVDRITETTSDEELEAIVHLVDTLPEAVDTLRTDVLPVMSTLGTVAPDLRDLLDIASQLNEVLGSVPGLGRIKKRVQKAQADEDGESYRADEAPPSSPDRDEHS
jgi:ABC-type transporter Mla subunit MlaD